MNQTGPAGRTADTHRLDREFDRQVDVLLTQGYPSRAGLSVEEFTDLIAPLRQVVRSTPAAHRPATSSRAPFVLVVSGALVRAEDLIPLTTLAGGTTPGVVDRNHGEQGLAPYRPLPELRIPHTPAYVLVDVDRGEEFRGIPPADARPTILGRGRTPLTIHEGIALITQFPALLARNHCFMLAGSRRGDRRVPALWISGKAPKLGWCWDGNPHTWLGMASAGERVAQVTRSHNEVDSVWR
jgi:hypothetical protein